MCSESLGSEKVSYGPCAHQESCESLAAMAKFLVIRFDRICSFEMDASRGPISLYIQTRFEVFESPNIS